LSIPVYPEKLFWSACLRLNGRFGAKIRIRSDGVSGPMNIKLTIISLGCLGLAPFIAATWLIISGSHFFSLDPLLLFGSYSAIILTFLGGVLWGRGLTVSNPQLRIGLLLSSNVVALIAWTSLLLAGGLTTATLTVLMLGFAVVYGIERLVREPDNQDYLAVYTNLRGLLTALVTGLHLLVLLIR